MPILAAYMVPHPPMIVPEVGRGSERQVEATRTAYLRAAEDIAALQPETVIISSPHATMYADYFHLCPVVWTASRNHIFFSDQHSFFVLPSR